MPSDIKDKDSVPIHEGDQVWTKIRGGKREGRVDKIVTTQEEAEAEAEAENVKNPPKILFWDQHKHNVAHNPETLQHSDEQDGKSRE